MKIPTQPAPLYMETGTNSGQTLDSESKALGATGGLSARWFGFLKADSSATGIPKRSRFPAGAGATRPSDALVKPPKLLVGRVSFQSTARRQRTALFPTPETPRFPAPDAVKTCLEQNRFVLHFSLCAGGKSC